MHPLLFNLGPIPIHSYGFLIAIGFLSAVFTIRQLAIRAKLDVDRVIDLTFWILLVGFIGARILFVITRWDYFSTDLAGIFRVWEGGLVFFGGPLAAVPFVVWYFRKYKLPAWKTADAMIPGLVIAHMFGRFGCLAAGCCYGKPTDGPFGIKLYSELVDADFRGIPLHPTQLYEAGSLLVLFIGLLIISRRKLFEGQVIISYFIAYPIIRSIIEVFRGDLIRGFVIDGLLSTSQFISILMVIAAGLVLYVRLRQVQGLGGSAQNQGKPA